MAHKAPWNKYEVALLIERYINVTQHAHDLDEELTQLSSDLRIMATNAGVQIDDVYRNFNGMRWHYATIKRIFAGIDDKTHQPTPLMREMVEMYDKDIDAFSKILKQAHERVGGSVNSTVCDMDNKQKFTEWLKTRYIGKITPNECLECLSAVSDYAIAHAFSKVSFWEITDYKIFNKIRITVLNNKIYKFTHPVIYHRFEKAGKIYSDFLKEVVCDVEDRNGIDVVNIASVAEVELLKEVVTTDESDISAFSDKQEILAEGTTINGGQETINSDEVFTIDFDAGLTIDFTRVASITYFNETVNNIKKWREAYTYIIKKLYSDYPDVLGRLLDNNDIGRYRIPCSIDGASFYSPIMIAPGFYVEGQRRASELIKQIGSLLDLCGVDYSKVIITYCRKDREASIPESEPNKDTVGTSEKVERKPRKRNVDPAADAILVAKIDSLAKERSAGLDWGIIHSELPGYSDARIRQAASEANLLWIVNKYYHPANIDDFDNMAEIILTILNRQFKAYGDYTSDKQLYIEARPKLDDFFFFNGAFDSRMEVYDIAAALYGANSYKGNRFVFRDRRHIWKTEPDYDMDFCGLLVKYAREHNNIFSRDKAIEYLEFFGAGTPKQTLSLILSHIGKSRFMQFSENRFVLAEALNIDERFLAILKQSIDNLLEGEDYIILDEITEYFYEGLPELPIGATWGPLLLEAILDENDIGFKTIDAGGSNDLKVVDAALIRVNSSYKTFADVLWNEMMKDYRLPITLSNEEFREYLLRKGFIHGTEKTYTVHKTVADDLRFLWTNEYTSVTISR